MNDSEKRKKYLKGFKEFMKTQAIELDLDIAMLLACHFELACTLLWSSGMDAEDGYYVFEDCGKQYKDFVKEMDEQIAKEESN